jgi:hypothetical protein
MIKTEASDYAIAGILLSQTVDDNMHPVTLYSHTLSVAKLNHDIHDKELLMIFKVFKNWQHYHKSPHHTINIITDNKNLEYFSSMKVLTYHQAFWSEYLSAFNRVIHFQPGKLGEKPDTLTWHADYYLKRGDRDYMLANPQNPHPMLMQEQLTTSLCVTFLCAVILDAAALVDSSIPIINTTTLAKDIKSMYFDDPIAKHKYNSYAQGVFSLLQFISLRFTLTGSLHICPKTLTQVRQPMDLHPSREAQSPNHWAPQL